MQSILLFLDHPEVINISVTQSHILLLMQGYFLNKFSQGYLISANPRGFRCNYPHSVYLTYLTTCQRFAKITIEHSTEQENNSINQYVKYHPTLQ